MQKLENTERPIKNGQSRETGNIGYTRRRKKSLFKYQFIKLNLKQHLIYQNTSNICYSTKLRNFHEAPPLNPPTSDQ